MITTKYNFSGKSEKQKEEETFRKMNKFGGMWLTYDEMIVQRPPTSSIQRDIPIFPNGQSIPQNMSNFEVAHHSMIQGLRTIYDLKEMTGK